MRQCGYCGKYSPGNLTECPDCHEPFPEMRVASRPRAERRGEIRRGLLYMLLAAVIHFFAGEYSAMILPVQIAPVVTLYLSPLLFLGGLGFVVYGLYLQSRA